MVALLLIIAGNTTVHYYVKFKLQSCVHNHKSHHYKLQIKSSLQPATVAIIIVIILLLLRLLLLW